MTRRKKTGSPGDLLPRKTEWIDYVPGAQPPPEVILIIYQVFPDETEDVNLGRWDRNRELFIDPEGHVLDSVTHYHILYNPRNQRLVTEDYDD